MQTFHFILAGSRLRRHPRKRRLRTLRRRSDPSIKQVDSAPVVDKCLSGMSSLFLFYLIIMIKSLFFDAIPPEPLPFFFCSFLTILSFSVLSFCTYCLFFLYLVPYLFRFSISLFVPAFTVEPRFSAFQGTIHIYALKRGHAIAGIGFTIA